MYLGCAGASDLFVGLNVARVDSDVLEVPVRLRAARLKGGHSGNSIDKGRANAIKLIAEMLDRCRECNYEFGLSSLSGGTARNAIPSGAEAIVRTSERGFQDIIRAARVFQREMVGIYGDADPDIKMEVSRAVDRPSEFSVLRTEDRDRVLDAIQAFPSGVLNMSKVVEGLVETSCNLAILLSKITQG